MKFGFIYWKCATRQLNSTKPNNNNFVFSNKFIRDYLMRYFKSTTSAHSRLSVA